MKSYVALLVSVFILSQAGVIVRLINMKPEPLGLWRAALVVGLLSLWRVFRHKQSALKIKSLADVSLWIAGLFFFLHFWIWFYAVHNTTVANAVLFFCLNPLFVAVGAAAFLKEKFTRPLGFAIAMGFFGVVLVEYDHLKFASGLVLGDLLALTAALMFTVYALIAKRARSKIRNFDMTLVFNLATLLGFFVACAVTERWQVPQQSSDWLGLIALAVGPSLLGHALFTFAIAHIPVGQASLFVMLEPIFAAIVGAQLFSEHVRTSSVIGFVLVTVGMLALLVQRKRR